MGAGSRGVPLCWIQASVKGIAVLHGGIFPAPAQEAVLVEIAPLWGCSLTRKRGKSPLTQVNSKQPLSRGHSATMGPLLPWASWDWAVSECKCLCCAALISNLSTCSSIGLHVYRVLKGEDILIVP